MPLMTTGISSVQLVWVLGTTSTGEHFITYTAPPALMARCPLPKMEMRLWGLSAPAMASNLVRAMSLLFSQMAPLTCLNFSFIDMEALTCMKDMPDSNRVRSASPSFPLKRPWATSMWSSLCTKTAMFLMWVLKAWCPHRMNDSATTSPAAWSLS